MKFRSLAIPVVVAAVTGIADSVDSESNADNEAIANDFGVDLKELEACLSKLMPDIPDLVSGGAVAFPTIVDFGDFDDASPSGGVGAGAVYTGTSDSGNTGSGGNTGSNQENLPFNPTLIGLLSVQQNSQRRREDEAAAAQDECLKTLTGIDIKLDFANAQDFGIDASGQLDLENIDFSTFPVADADGFFPLSGKEFDGFPALDDAPNFSFDDFGSYPEGFDVSEITFDFSAVPALLAEIAAFAQDFLGFEPDLDLFNSFDENDKKLVRESLNATLTKLDISVNDTTKQQLADLLSKSTPTLEELKNVTGDNSTAAKIEKNLTDIVDGFGNINYYKNSTADEICDQVKAKLDGFKEIEDALLAGLPDGWTLNKFCKLAKKAGFDVQALKKFIAKPENFKFKNAKKNIKKNSRREDEEEPATTFSKTQVQNQAKLANTQNNEKKRDKEAKDTADSGATTIAISTASIAVSAVAFFM